jgi:uncharacterized repeat protein (TIGR01451 family)
MVPVLPDEEEHGTAPGADPPIEAAGPGDLPHERVWDLHVWCRPASGGQCSTEPVPTISMLNPGDAIPGIDPHVGASPPASWPLTPTDELPWFYYPQRAADLSASVIDSADTVKVGKRLAYTVTVSNMGPDSATRVILTDSVPRHADSLTITASQGECSQTKTTVRCDIGTLAADASAQIGIELRPNTKGTVTNTASVSGSEYELKEKEDPALGWTRAGALDDNTATESTTVLP